MSRAADLPRWAELAVLPVVNLALALTVAALVVAVIGFQPGEVLALLVKGAFGSKAGLGYTLYYATTFVFTGLAVAVAVHAGLLNIGAEGQAMLGGLGVGLASLGLAPHLPMALMLPVNVLAAALFGLAWAAVPAALQAWRGSHVVITTIMFNFIAAALLGWLLVNVLKEPGNMAAETAAFGASARVPGVHEVLAALGLAWPQTPLNLSIVLALAAAVAVWLVVWKSRPGYALRAVGFAPEAALYAGIRPPRVVMLSMAISGALAGLVAVNEVAGAHGRLLAEFVAGAGFTGIAVSLIGRNHPLGVVLAALLFGALYQGGTELSFDMPRLTKEVVVVIQGLVILFCGAFEGLFRPRLLALFARKAPAAAAAAAE